MTVGELKAKLAIYKDDVEIFTNEYDDVHGSLHYNTPRLEQVDVDAHYSKDKEFLIYSRWAWWKDTKQATILVIE